MPLAAIEILSPTQGMRDVYVKIRAYFALHLKSCWIVNPSMKVVAVYSPSDEHIFRSQSLTIWTPARFPKSYDLDAS